MEALQQELATAKLATAQEHSRASTAEANATKARLEAERAAVEERDTYAAQLAAEVEELDRQLAESKLAAAQAAAQVRQYPTASPAQAIGRGCDSLARCECARPSPANP